MYGANRLVPIFLPWVSVVGHPRPSGLSRFLPGLTGKSGFRFVLFLTPCRPLGNTTLCEDPLFVQPPTS